MQAWSWADRFPEVLTEFSFVSAVRAGASPGSFTLVLGPVGYGKVSLTLDMELRVLRERGRLLRLQSIPERGNADATISLEVCASPDLDTCDLTISLDVSPHKPAAAFWPREWIEKATSASLQLAARKMLKDMKAAIEGGGAHALQTDAPELRLDPSRAHAAAR